MLDDLVYVIPKEMHSEEQLKEFLVSHPEIKFVSLVCIDLAGNDTDEKIPIKLFLEDMSKFIKGCVQTDGSSVVLPGIATLNNAKVDMIVDMDVNWFIDYNYEFIDCKTEKPTGTLRIPCFLYHENKPVDSRYILKKSIEYFKTTLLNLIKTNPESISSFNIKYEDIEKVDVTCATELEFWVKTPNDNAEVDELCTSQVLHEQYWNRTKGSVRTALEESLLLMEYHGLEPEMGHKEVGGVKAKLTSSGGFTHIMEQLEVDWKYSTALQAGDNELLVKSIIKETFRNNKLDVTFFAKPIDEVAGSGKHVHLGVALKLKNGKRINLFSTDKNHYLSSFGYASIMGILKNYEVINPFVSSTNDSLKRLKPGFEAPVCIVTSLGHTVQLPSRNRTILVGVIRDLDNSLATRFELRSPNPRSNTYLTVASLCMSMIDGIKYAIENNKCEDDLLKELSKAAEEDTSYLEKGRQYRSEEDVFEYYSEEERSKIFGTAPSTVYENICSLDKYMDKIEVLKAGEVFTSKIVNSYKLAVIERWLVEITNRIIPNYVEEIRSFSQLHEVNKASDLDIHNWSKINELRQCLMKDTYSDKSLFGQIREAKENNDYETISNLQLEIDKKMKLLRKLYSDYKKNLLDI
ncbi:glutamine synthetase [Clostridium botulinum B2 433]|uniref:glutamine synthetase n=1 Tax=Clostridium botulinum TaxID=1491 RepID=UPI0007E1B10F|nr:glutamine synthetase [Clostridium botulinum]KEI84386.1 glutamine synthetase [Clostridium botulinum B2 433]